MDRVPIAEKGRHAHEKISQIIVLPMCLQFWVALKLHLSYVKLP